MALLAANKNVFYHSLDSGVEYTQGRTWVAVGNTASGLTFITSPIHGNGAHKSNTTAIAIGYNNYAEGLPYTFISATDDILTAAFWVSGCVPCLYARIGGGPPANPLDNRNAVGVHITASGVEVMCEIGDVLYTWPHLDIGAPPDISFFVIRATPVLESGTTHAQLSVNGSEWLDCGSIETTTWTYENIQNGTIGIFLSHQTSGQLIDEAILWRNNDTFTSAELTKLYELGNTYHRPMNEYTLQYQNEVDLGVDEIALWGDTERFTPLELAQIYALGDFYKKPLNQYTETFITEPGGVPASGRMNLYVGGTEYVTLDTSLAISGFAFDSVAGSISLFVKNTPPPPSGTAGIPIDTLLRTGDYHPQVVGKLDYLPPGGVYIEIWDLASGSQVFPENSGCYPIGDTGRWGWSTANVPEPWPNKRPQYYYRMTAEDGSTFAGEFFLTTRGGAKRPVDRTSYIHTP